MSYRWLVANAVVQGLCLLLICLTIFLIALIDLKDNDFDNISVYVLHVDFNGPTDYATYSVF